MRDGGGGMGARCESRCLLACSPLVLPLGKAAPPKLLTLHPPATSPFCAWAGRGQQGPGRGPLPQALRGPWGAPWA